MSTTEHLVVEGPAAGLKVRPIAASQLEPGKLFAVVVDGEKAGSPAWVDPAHVREIKGRERG